ncbi:MAG: hypothetical protein M1833_000666 [Piccolia ochrophora]|nr:MAG: hypothetical protein M1833_000666 [Piccolia ochrophora]
MALNPRSVLFTSFTLILCGHAVPLTTYGSDPVALTANPGTTTPAEGTCGPIERYYHPTQKSWYDANTGPWLDQWWNANSPQFGSRNGFAGTLGSTFLGNPDWTCLDDGSVDNCDLDPCNNPKLNAAGKDIQPAYYVLLSMRNLHSFFSNLKAAFSISGIFASLKKDEWAWTYYKDKDDVDMTAQNELFVGLMTVVGISAAFAAPLKPAVNGIAAGASAAFSGAVFATKNVIQNATGNDTPQKGAEMGGKLADLFIKSISELITVNNALMKGSKYGDHDARSHIANGQFIEKGDIDQNDSIRRGNTLLAATAINYLWKQQKIFIVGGGDCEDTGGIGSGPQEAKLCRDGKAWYLFYWREYLGSIDPGKKRWGNVDVPPGFPELQSEGITVQDIIGASLDAFIVAGQKYTGDVHLSRTEQALMDGAIAPKVGGPSWEGTFTIPVCNVSSIVPISGDDFPKKDVIIQPWGAKKVPQWCAPVCNLPGAPADEQTTRDFIDAAQMRNFHSFQSYCPDGRWIMDQ